MNTAGNRHRRLVFGLGQTGIWFMLSRAAQMASGVWVTRQLDPRDFSLLAIIFAIQGVAVQVTAVNLTSELVRASSLAPEDLEVSWSYEWARNLVLWLFLFAFAPYLAAWMGHPEAGGALRLSACGLLIGSLRNPRLVELRRAGRFGRLAWIESAPLLAYAVCAVGFVWLCRSYYGLIYAGLASAVFGVALSYHQLPWRPRLNFDFQRVRPMLSFGLVLLVATGLLAMREHGIVFVVSAAGMQDSLGYLNRGVAFSMALALQAEALFWKVAYPHYAQVHLEGGDAVHDAIVTNRWLLILGVPAALVVAYFADFLVPLALGEKWRPVIPLWSWLVIAGSLMIANAPLETALQVMRRENVQTAILGVTICLHLALSWFLLPKWGITAVGIAALISTVIGSVLLGITLRNLRANARQAGALPETPLSSS